MLNLIFERGIRQLGVLPYMYISLKLINNLKHIPTIIIIQPLCKKKDCCYLNAKLYFAFIKINLTTKLHIDMMRII